GKTATATAMVLFPKATQPKDGYRVVVWEHGTVGVGDGCAPSKNAINPRFKILAESLLAAGYVIVAPDYEGLGTPGVHPYLNLSSEAKSALAAVKAVKEHYGAQLKGDWMSIGQSQGGHASLGTAEFANTDASYKGAVAGAPASSLGTIIQIYIDPQFNLDSNGKPK
ncbi:alpha/beta hydrolase, partial [Acinetobacter baumannii]|nr:alpha/beta hydrolase [Acinetobacter baumannii]